MDNLQKFKDTFARRLYNMTVAEAVEKGVCIRCKKPPTYVSEAGRREYPISGLCEPCFKGIMASQGEGE